MRFRNVIDQGTGDDEGVSQSRAVAWRFREMQSHGQPEEGTASGPSATVRPLLGTVAHLTAQPRPSLTQSSAT